MTPELFRKLAALGLSSDQMAGVLEIMESEAEQRKEKGRARWHKWKDNQPANISKRLSTTANVNSQLAHVEDNSPKVEVSGKKEGVARQRASRLPEDWTLPEAWLQKALSEGMTRQAALASAERMKNWSLSAKDGAKIDWHPTWLNWFRRDLAKATAPPDKPKKVTVASMWRDEGRKAGLLPNEPPLEINGRMDAGHGNGSAPSTNLARRIASAGSG